jgi:hypothetical protein
LNGLDDERVQVSGLDGERSVGVISKWGKTHNKGMHITKLLLAVALVGGGQGAFSAPTQAAAAEQANQPVRTKEAALQQAKALGLIPESAVIAEALQQTSPTALWTISFSSPAKGTSIAYTGTVQISSNNGEPLSLVLNSSLDAIGADPNAPAFNTAKQKISYEQASTIAKAFIGKQTGALADQWLMETAPESAYSTRYESDAYHKIRYNMTYGGIRLAGSTSRVFVDRISGEVAAYQLQWKKQSSALPVSKLTSAQASKLLYDRMELLVDAPPSGSKGQEPVYSLFGPLLINAVTGQSDSSTPPAYIGKQKPSYPASLAKKRLLSLYEVELQYLNDGKELVYRLKLKPNVPLFYSGPEPSIGAVSGAWQDYLGAPITATLPEASDWLIAAAAAPAAITYKAGIVLNGKLLQLSGEPIVADGHTLIPFRDLLAEMGAAITWDGKARKVTASMHGTELELMIGSSTALVDGKSYRLSAPVQLTAGKTYIPLRFAAEALGAKVKWNNESRLAVVSTQSAVKPLTAAELAQLRFKQQVMIEELQWKAKGSK